MKFLLRVLILLIILVAGGMAFVYSGFYNVAATEPHWKPVREFLGLTMDRSVEHHAAGIIAPDNLEDTAVIHRGFQHFQEMCVQCHGAPGVDRSEMAKGLNPKAPKLLWATKEDGPGELFWITKNGVKMTGMPAFAPTHTDEEIWAIVAFLKKLPTFDSASYAELSRKWCDKGEGSGEDIQCHRTRLDCERQSDGTEHH